MFVRIPIDQTLAGYGQVLRKPEIAVLDFIRPRGYKPSATELERAPLLFRIWVMNSAITSGRWEKVGQAALRPEFREQVSRFKVDPITGGYSLYFNATDHPAQPNECAGLEPATLWSAEHVEARLRNQLQGRAFDPLSVFPRPPR